VLTAVTISGNAADSDGGGIANYSYVSPVLINVTISGNSAYAGGGIFNNEASPVLTNVAISGNSASDTGGGIYNNTFSSSALTNVTISGNHAINAGGGFYNVSSSDFIIRNSIIWGNTATNFPGISNDNTSSTISYSIVQGCGGSDASWVTNIGIDGGNNQDVDPLFLNLVAATSAPTDAGNYRLQDGTGGAEGTAKSPAINAGNDNDYPGPSWNRWETLIGPNIITEDLYNAYIKDNLGGDLDGFLRFKGSAIDMGAYEKE
jgi:hypothetical protein